MKIEGGCYCGAVRYKAEGEPMLKAECFRRECQYIVGGGNLLIMAMPVDGFELTKGSVKGFTHVPGFKAGVIIKVGSFDDPSIFGKADNANFVCDAQPYHRLPDDMPVHQKWMHN